MYGSLEVTHDRSQLEWRASEEAGGEVLLDHSAQAGQRLRAALPPPCLGLADASRAIIGVQAHEQDLDGTARRPVGDLEGHVERDVERNRLHPCDLLLHSMGLSTFFQRSVSALMNSAICCGVLELGSAPRALKRSLTSGTVR